MFIFIIRRMELQHNSIYPEAVTYPEPDYPDRPIIRIVLALLVNNFFPQLCNIFLLLKFPPVVKYIQGVT